MDLSESFFTRYSNWQRKKNRKIEESHAAFFEDEIKSIQVFFSLICPKKRILFRKGDGFGSVGSGIVFLPEKISIFQNKLLNRKIYLHKALVAGIILKHRVCYLENWSDKKRRAFQVWALQGLFREYLAFELPSYNLFFDELFEAIGKRSYRREKNDEVFRGWVKHSRPISGEGLNENLKHALESLYKTSRDIHTKRLTYYPMSELMLSCGLMSHSKKPISSLPYEEKSRETNAYETEIEGKSVSDVDLTVVDLDKKKDQENPIMHSFESLHTADEYQGGYRVSDASDELADHQNALDELHLEVVTRSGDQASSVYRAFIDGFIEMLDSVSKKPKGLPSTTYPEWDYKQNILKKDHCRLYFPKRIEIKDVKAGAAWQEDLREKYQREIGKWEKKIAAIVNTEVWINRQWSGVEIDIESYINFRGDVSRGNFQETPLYLNQKKATLDTACLMLFDQSFSTDSWVQNKRVLDIELEAIGLTGLLTHTFMDSVAVAGTWSETRNHCYYNLYKDFGDSWTQFYQNAPEVAPQGYTRLGPSIRHSIEKLCGVAAKQRLLIILTDGKPTDYDRYEGVYGIEDVRNAVISAEKSGIFVKALAIEKKNAAHLEQIFGKGRYTVLNDIKRFPESLLKICLESIDC